MTEQKNKRVHCASYRHGTDETADGGAGGAARDATQGVVDDDGLVDEVLGADVAGPSRGKW